MRERMRVGEIEHIKAWWIDSTEIYIEDTVYTDTVYIRFLCLKLNLN